MKRFWDKVDKSGECWEWTGARQYKGYGQFRRGKKHGFRQIGAHRMSWILANGREVPDGMMVCHKCDNPPCVRPDHLFIAPAPENVADMINKRRRGRPSPPTIPAGKIEAIRRCRESGWSYTKLADHFKVSTQTAWKYCQ